MSAWSGILGGLGSFFGPVGTAIGGGLGGLLDSRNASSGQNQANDVNLQSVREQMAFQERMSGSQYQRGMADMKAAGLNPMLAVSAGGAGTPSGGAAVVQNPQMAGIAGAQSGANTLQALQGLSATQAQIDQTRAMTEKIRADTVAGDIVTARAVAELGGSQWRESRESAEATTAWSETVIRRAMAENARRLHTASASKAESEAGIAASHEARESSSWQADVRERKARARLTELESGKQEVLKGLYQLAPQISGSARRLWEDSQLMPRQGVPWWKGQ